MGLLGPQEGISKQFIKLMKYYIKLKELNKLTKQSIWKVIYLFTQIIFLPLFIVIIYFIA